MSTLQAIADLKRIGKSLSLDKPIGGTDDEPLYRDMPDEGPTAFDLLDREDQRAAIAAALERLPLRERLIVVARFGLDGASTVTLAEIGECFALCRQRAQQLEAKSLARMRAELGQALGLSVDSTVPALARSRRKR